MPTKLHIDGIFKISNIELRNNGLLVVQYSEVIEGLNNPIILQSYSVEINLNTYSEPIPEIADFHLLLTQIANAYLTRSEFLRYAS